MKQILSFCFALICISRVWAYDAIINGIYYNLNVTDLTAEVTNETGDWDAHSYSDSVVISSTIQYNNKTYSVTTIGDWAFNGCIGLTSVTIPNSVITIGERAFYDCRGLTSITIPNSVTTIEEYAFCACSSLPSVIIPQSVTTIGELAFYGCSGLTSVKWNAKNCSYSGVNFDSPIGSQVETFIFGDSVQVIPDWICSNMRKLTSIIIPNSVTTIGERAFYDCRGLTSVTIPNSVTTIGWYAFCSCERLTSVTLGNSITTIENGAFYYCSGLTSITIPNSVTTIGEDAFGHCSGLTSVTLGNSVTTIGKYAFCVCSGLTSITCYATTPPTCSYGCFEYVDKSIPIYVPARSVNAYKQSSEWKDFTKLQANPDDLAVVTCIAKNGISVGTGTYIKGDTCTLTIIPDAGYQFTQWNDGNTDNPRSFVVTQNTTFTAQIDTLWSGQCGDNLYWQYGNGSLNITGYGAMYDNQPWLLFVDSITEISLPAELTTIGAGAFANIVKLNNITIPAMVTTIEANAFSGCRKLFDIYCYAIEPPVAQTSSFENYNVYLHVPCDNLRDYQMDAVFGSFKYVVCISAESTETQSDDVIVAPSVNDATFTWPANDQTDSYSLEITKDSVVFCTLKFNANGQLTGISFAPGRGHTAMAHTATTTGAGWQFTVTGLNQASKYGYTLDVTDAQKQSIKTYTGEFATDGYTDLLPLPYEGKAGIGSVKFIKDGRLFIERNGIRYDARGARIK